MNTDKNELDSNSDELHSSDENQNSEYNELPKVDPINYADYQIENDLKENPNTDEVDEDFDGEEPDEEPDQQTELDEYAGKDQLADDQETKGKKKLVPKVTRKGLLITLLTTIIVAIFGLLLWVKYEMKHRNNTEMAEVPVGDEYDRSQVHDEKGKQPSRVQQAEEELGTIDYSNNNSIYTAKRQTATNIDSATVSSASPDGSTRPTGRQLIALEQRQLNRRNYNTASNNRSQRISSRYANTEYNRQSQRQKDEYHYEKDALSFNTIKPSSNSNTSNPRSLNPNQYPAAAPRQAPTYASYAPSQPFNSAPASSSAEASTKVKGYDFNNPVRGIVAGDQKVISGDKVKFQLLDECTVENYRLPKGTIVVAIANVAGTRVNFTVESVRLGNDVLPVSLAIYDVDMIAGLPFRSDRNRKRQAKQQADQAAVQSLNQAFATARTGNIGADAAAGFAQGISRALIQGNRREKLQEISLQHGYHVYFVPAS